MPPTSRLMVVWSAALTQHIGWIRQLWSIDTINIRLMTFTNSLPLPVTLTSPPNQAPGIGTIINNIISNVSLDWEALTGATSYQWQLDYDTNFSTVLFEDSTKASSARLPALEPATTYYWKVRATGSDTFSTWSAVGAFTTEPPPSPPPPLAPESASSSSPPPPPASPQPTIPDWIIYLVGGLLLTIILLLITMLALVIGIRRL